MLFENFSIFENNIINVKLAKVLRYMLVSWEPTVILLKNIFKTSRGNYNKNSIPTQYHKYLIPLQ
jgi:hypothetical protein